jgi:PA-IL-like protein
MFLKSKIYRVAIACCLVLSMFVLTFADTIRLKDGSIIKGKIVSFGEGKFTILIGDGARQRQMNFFADEVDSIEFDSTPIQTSNVKTSLPTYTETSAKKETPNKNNTVITVGQPDTKPTPQPTPSKTVIITDKTTEPNTNTSTNSTPTNTNPTTTTNTNPTNTTVKTDTQSKPITLNVKVLADNTANGWTNSGWVVKKGQKIRISSRGQINLGNGRYSSSAGVSSLPDKDKLIKAEATGGLIAVIGDDNNEFVFVGASREFVAPRDGALFLGINEGNLEDNSGSFEVTIEIEPN